MQLLCSVTKKIRLFLGISLKQKVWKALNMKFVYDDLLFSINRYDPSLSLADPPPRGYMLQISLELAPTAY